MQHETIISGFGGQGALTAGQVLARAAMQSGLHVTWLPSYGPEMRGGKARCTVITGPDEIGAPLVRYPSGAVVLNIPSMEAFEAMVRPGGTLVVNSSLIPLRSERADMHAVYVPATELATEIGDVRLTNMLCLGAYVAASRVVSHDSLREALRQHLPERHKRFLEPNLVALARGGEVAAQQLGL
jgi:2-oxoglutarate ferredoxin oxidoreductase subunit gamma